MSITIEAIYESGVLKPLTPLPNLKEHERVKLIVETESMIARQRQERIQIDPEAERELIDNPEYSLLES